jgi:hypothetical protein
MYTTSSDIIFWNEALALELRLGKRLLKICSHFTLRGKRKMGGKRLNGRPNFGRCRMAENISVATPRKNTNNKCSMYRNRESSSVHKILFSDRALIVIHEYGKKPRFGLENI